MTEIGLGIFEEDYEGLKEKIELFEKEKKEFQDHLLERTSVVTDAIAREIAKKFDVSHELAKTVYVLEFEYNIPKLLSASYYNFEINRLKEEQYELPDIYSFRVRFSIEEGFWVKYLAIDLPKKLIQKMNKLVSLDRSIFGDMEGEKDDSASYILERAYLCNEIVHPILISWTKDHHRANYYDAAAAFVCGMQQKANEKATIIIEEMGNRFYSNMEIIENILSEIPSLGWILKAKEEFAKTNDRIKFAKRDNKKIDWRIAAEIILETLLVMEYETIGLADQNFREKDLAKRKQVVSETIAAKRKDFVTDAISRFITNIDNLNHQQLDESIKELVRELYNSAIVVKREKPANFARNFIERIMMELSINQLKITKYIKKFDSQFMYRLSAAGSKDFPGLSVDEKVTGLVEDLVKEIITNREKMVDDEEVKRKAAEQMMETQTAAKVEEEEIKANEISFRDRILHETEKELWIHIRDEYLKELFTNLDEKKSAAIILKRFSLELGLLLTQGEALSIITTELTSKDIDMSDSNKEELDTQVCKIVYKQIKDQRNNMKK